MWLALPLSTRQKIANDFNLTKTGQVEVVNDKVYCDGYTDNDLMKITEEGLRERLKRAQKTLPKEFKKVWDYYVADMSEEEIKYSTDEKLNEGIAKSLGAGEKEVPVEKEHIPISTETIKKMIEPKKIGRLKGSKNNKKK